MDNTDFICNHLELTKGALIDIINKKNLTTLDEIIDETDAGSVCGTCIPDIENLLAEILSKKG